MTQFDRAITTTTSYYSYEKGYFELVKKVEEIENFSGIWETVTYELVSDRMVEKKRERTLGGVVLRKSGVLTSKDDMMSFLSGIGDTQVYAPVIREKGSFWDYHDSCVEQGFSLYTNDEDQFSESIGKYLPLYQWDSMHEGPVDYGAVTKITYSAGGEKFTLHSRSMYLDEYENYSDFDISDEVQEILRFSFSSKDGWVVKQEFDSGNQYFMSSESVDQLPDSEEECEGYDY